MFVRTPNSQSFIMTRQLLVLGAFLLASCSDANTGPKAGGDGISASVIPCDQQFIPEPDCQDPGPPAGGGINPYDTYVAANVVQSYTTAIVDESTGATNTMQSDPIPFVLEAGYSLETGADLVQQVFSDLAADDPVRVIRLDGNRSIELGADGSTAPAAPSDLDGSVLNPIATMPDLGMFPSLIDAIAGGETGAFKVSSIADQMTLVSARVVQIRSGVSARMLDADHLSLVIGGSGARGGDGTLEVSFQRNPQNRGWILRRVDQTSDVSERGKRATMRSRTEFRGMRVARNMDADRLRDAKRAKRFDSYRDVTVAPSASVIQAPVTAGVSASVIPGENWSSTGIVTWNPPSPLPYPVQPPTLPAPGYNPDDRSDEEIQGCESSAFSTQNRVAVSGGGPRVVFQHGFGSDACTWKYFVPFFPQYASAGRVIGITTPIIRYEDQATQLRDQIPAGSTGWIFVGHSNGGIISRYLAQTRPAGFAKAVITINSPHQGAPIVTAAARALSSLEYMSSVASLIYARGSLGAANMGAIISPNSVLRRIFNGGIVLQQMAPGSAFLTDLAARQESNVRRYAIRSQVHEQWQSVRVFCDRKASTSQGVPMGRRCVEDTKRMVKRSTWRAIASGLLSVVAVAIPVVGPFLASSLKYDGKASATLVALLYSVDIIWRDAFSGFAPSDGVVPMSSQRWVGANAERVITGADSHVGSTKSDLVRAQLAQLLVVASQ
jgi:pimeloyl-ACP methyl ester carboxylesterase